MIRTDPRFSIIIPTRNRRGPLAACLNALQNLDFPQDDFEVIVVDDGGSEPIPDPDRVYRQLNVRWLRLHDNRGPAAARNEGAAHARGRYLAFLDDDCTAAQTWLTKLNEALEETPHSAAGGRVVNGCPENLYAEANQAILDEVYRHYNADPVNSQFLATMNLAVPAQDFRDMGGFHPAFRASEDREFCARWLERGLPLVYAEEAVVTHHAAPGWREFWNRHYRFGDAAYHFRKSHAVDRSGRIQLEPAGFYRRLLLSPLRGTGALKGLQASFLCCISQLSSALGFWAAHRRARTI